jgi:hypothetical protein
MSRFELQAGMLRPEEQRHGSADAELMIGISPISTALVEDAEGKVEKPKVDSSASSSTSTDEISVGACNLSSKQSSSRS